MFMIRMRPEDRRQASQYSPLGRRARSQAFFLWIY